MSHSWMRIENQGKRYEKAIKFCFTMAYREDADDKTRCEYLNAAAKFAKQLTDLAYQIQGVKDAIKAKSNDVERTELSGMR